MFRFNHAPRTSRSNSKLAEDQLDELYRKIQGGDEGDSVDEQVLKARAALNLINRVRDANKIETAKAGDTFRGVSKETGFQIGRRNGFGAGDLEGARKSLVHFWCGL